MLELIALVSGALVMVLEMVGARVMAPHLGTSVIVWTSLIGVVLACLALGAWLGGRMADRTVSRARLAAILAWAGCGSALTGLLHSTVAGAVADSVPSLHMAAVLCAILLLAFPATFFGMVTPYVIRLRMEGVSSSGRTVGNLYALSTIGSIAGTFLGGFVLVSWFDSTHILLGTGAGMLLLSLLACPRAVTVRAALLALVCLGGWASASYQAFEAAASGTLAVETPYNHIRIVRGLDHEGRELLCLATDPGRFQSAMYVDDPAGLALPYTRFFALGPAVVPDARRVLMLGGGAFSVPRWLLAGRSALDPSTLGVDVVELDPGMTRTAREHFGLADDPRLRVVHEDARTFCNRNTERYDLVFVDVFGSCYTVPFQAGTEEAAAAMRRAVKDNGALVMNVIASLDGGAGRLFRSIHAGLARHFAEVLVFAVTDPADPEVIQNLMLLALPVPRPDLAQTLAGSADPALAPLLAARVTAPIPSIPPLRDDFAPVERYSLALLPR
jgi:predicted membrane-bound spermidine synthase